MAFVGHGDAHDFTGSSITSLTMTYTSTAGNVLAFMIFANVGASPIETGVTITDNASGGSSTITHPTGAYGNDASNNYAWGFYCNSCKAATSFTINLTQAGQSTVTFPMAILAEYSAWGNFSAFGTPNFQATTGTTTNTIVSGSASLASGAHVWGCTISYLATNETITHGTTPIAFTSDYYQNVGSSLNQYMIESGTAGSSSTFAATFGSNAATSYVTGMLAFAAAAAATFIPPRRLIKTYSIPLLLRR